MRAWVGGCDGVRAWVRTAEVCVQVELVKRNVDNYEFLHRMVLKQHSKGACVWVRGWVGKVCVQVEVCQEECG